MSNQFAWNHARKRNPLIKRNAIVSAFGSNWRIASMTDTDGIILRREMIVHPADIKQSLALKGEVMHPVIAKLKALSIDELSPLEALAALAELKRMAQS